MTENIIDLKNECYLFIEYAIDPLLPLFRFKEESNIIIKTRWELYCSINRKRKLESLCELRNNIWRFRYSLLQKIEEQMYGSIRIHTEDVSNYFK